MDSFENGKKKMRETAPQLKVDTKDLLSELASKIAREFGIDVSQVQEIIRSESNIKLESLKGIIQETELSGTINFQRLKTVLNGARSVVEKVSRNEIELLKGSLGEEKLFPENNFYISNRLVSTGTLTRLYSPQGISDQVLGGSIGLINSVEATVQLLYDIGSGIVKTPYHIYLIVSGKGVYEGIKRI